LKKELEVLKKELEIFRKTTTNLHTQLAESDQSVKLARLQENVSDLNKHHEAAKSQHKSELGCQKTDFEQHILDLNQ
jgi:hypothetical protein